MKFAIIADIHANLDAFQVVLEDCKKQQVTHYACLGDVVGYNANPKECLDIVRAMNMPCVKGNHDEYCSTEEHLEGFNPAAAEAVNWTRKQLTEEDRLWLRELKYTRMVTNFTIVHATLDAPQRWGYVFDKLAAAASFTYQNTQVCFFGHTHVPVAFMRDSVVRGGTYSKFKVEAGKKYFVNVGAVGQIIATPKMVVLLSETFHDYQLVPTDGRPHRDDAPPSYRGDAVGHWDGDTFVVDVTNFTDDTWMSAEGRVSFHSDALHIVERYRRVDANTLETERGLRLRADKIVLCTGGKSRGLNVPGAALTATHSDAWSLRSVPRSMLVIGGGATGAGFLFGAVLFK